MFLPRSTTSILRIFEFTSCACAVKIDLVWPEHLGHIDTRSSRCLAWIARDKFNIKPTVGTCRKRTISAPELENNRHERWEQKLEKEMRKQQKIFYHPHVYVKNVVPCNFFVFVPLFPNLFDVPLFLTIFCFLPMFPLPNFPSVFPCSQKTPGGPSHMSDTQYKDPLCGPLNVPHLPKKSWVRWWRIINLSPPSST